MERGIGAWLLLAAGIILGLTLGGVWMQWTVFTPDDSGSDAAAILADPTIRENLRDLIAGIAAPAMETTQTQLAAFLDEQIMQTQAGTEVLGETVGRVERVVIGQSSDPVVLTGPALVPIVRDQRVANVPDIPIPVETSGTLSGLRSGLLWAIPIGFLATLALLALGAFGRPERAEIVRVAGESLIAIAVAMLLFGVFLPIYVIPALDSAAWVAMAPRLSMARLPTTLGIVVVTAIAGVLLIIRSMVGGAPRRQWSTPLSANRYRSERGWS